MSFCIAERTSEVQANAPRRARGPLRVLFVTPYLPSPPRFGGQRRLHGLISGVAASHEVSVLSLVDPGEDLAEALHATSAYCRRVATVPSPHYGRDGAYKRALQLRSLLSSRSFERMVHAESLIADALDRMLAAAPYDLVQFEFVHTATYGTARAERLRSKVPFILDEHNIEYDILARTARAGASFARRAYSTIDGRKVRAEEIGAWAHLDGCTLTSERDRDVLLSEAPWTRTAVVRNGVDLDGFRPAAAAPEPRSVLFFGAIDYYPNTDGLLFFLDEVMPRLRATIPGVHLCIVGRRPPEAITARRGPDVEITGAVDDVRPYIERAAVVVVPLRIGGGTRLKILEAMAMGKAVVSTTLGAEGLDAVAERDLSIADDAAGLAAKISALLDDPERSRGLGVAARRFVEQGHGWAASVARLTGFYEEILEARGLA
jgi:glycosyltransferase involved in cell wall biosynthesis